MKIALLREREPFERLFAQSATRALHTLDGAPFGVAFRDRPAWPGERHWLCNSALNAIYQVHARDEIKLAVQQHYGHSETRWKRLLQKVYVRTSAARLGEYVLADSWLEIVPTPQSSRSLLFRGGGQRYRLFDYSRREVHALPKADDSLVTERELELRGQLPDGFPAPSVTSGPRPGISYTEALVSGAPLDQVPEGERGRHWRTIGRALARLTEATASTETRPQYVARVAERIESRLAAPLVDATTADGARRAIAELSQSASNGDTVEVAVTHGDLHAGNVLVGDSGPQLTDWEFVEVRPPRVQVIDCITGAHHADGVTDRLVGFVRRGPSAQQREFARAALGDDCGIDGQQWRARAAAEVMLEKLDNHCRTALAPHLDRVGPELAAFCREAGRFTQRSTAA